MPSSPTPQKAPSIEDLLKKTAATNAAPAAAAPGYVAGAPQKPKTTKAKAPSQYTVTEKLEEKSKEIKQDSIEKQTAERAASLGLPYINLQGFPITPESITVMTKKEAEDLHVVCFFNQNNEIRLATTEPGKTVNELATRVAKEYSSNVQIYLVSPLSMTAALKIYAAVPEIKETIYGLRVDEEALKRYEKEISNFKDLQEKISTVSTSDVITLMMGAALKSGASDIHVEAEEEDIKLRFRVDGLLQDAARLPRDAWKQMISRLKLLAGVKMNIEGIPQDGRITIYLSNEKIDIRVSFLPTAFGESVVMRILRPKAISLDFENLGVRGLAWEQLKREIERPNGMIITTGPTGSGKTTTLYAILKKLNTPDVKIITLEDPVEYKLQGINQSQIDHTKNYDFAKGLRSILRQDPDVVMVGEIRDLETADIAIQAALTGHLVISTIHTNSAAGAIPRFLSMGVKPFLLAPAINAIIGQRLVRRLCPDCKTKITLEPSLLTQVTKELEAIPKKAGVTLDLKALQFYGTPSAPTGCKTCNDLGYKGRVGIYEIMTMGKEIEKMILTGNVSEYDMADQAAKQGMLTMAQDGLLKALDGLTSVEEVLRVAAIEDDEDETATPVVPAATTEST